MQALLLSRLLLLLAWLHCLMSQAYEGVGLIVGC
jgi:hypothetical protein